MGHPATWNDKTLVLSDDLICNVYDGNLYNDHQFRLYECDFNDKIVKVFYKGVWFIVDNDYLSLSCTVPLIKDATSYESTRFSKWLESMCKDVKCAFGTLKRRWEILRYGLCFASIKQCEKLWLTFCVLHDKLLFVDRLHKSWVKGVLSKWEESNKDYKKNVTKTQFAASCLGRRFYDG